MPLDLLDRSPIAPEESSSSDSPARSHRRFTLDGSQSLEQQLQDICQQFRLAVQRIIPAALLKGIVLGGGYGRGEGGVLKTSEGDLPYNDVEFYLLVQSPEFLMKKVFGSRLHREAERLSHQHGIEVEFRILTLGNLRRTAPSMFYYDLLLGHRIVLGNPDLLQGCGKHCNSAQIPAEEAVRLLMNRCTGLLLSKVRLQKNVFTPADSDFVVRNLAKAQLAMGDALLTFEKRYHWSCQVRGKLLRDLLFQGGPPWANELLKAHASGIEFKLHPRKGQESRPELSAELTRISTLALKVWLWIESRRLKAAFDSIQDYALSPIDKWGASHPVGNVLRNLRLFRTRRGKNFFRHPRNRVLNSLVLLLWCDNPFHEISLSNKVQEELGEPVRGLPQAVESYLNLWSQLS